LATLRYQFQCHRAPLIEKTGAILFIYNACTARHKPPNAVSSKWGYGIDAQKGIVIKHIRQRLIDPETGKLTAAPQDAAILSRRERLIVFLLACGETIKEIAYSLSVSTSTITGHAKHLRQGLRIHTQALLTRWAMSHSRAKAGAAVGIKQHPEGCTCGEPFCTYARGAGEDIASIPPDADPDPKT
jgi:DNA-binding CsgD family transcriptional regulator